MPHKKGPARIEKAFDVAVTDVLPYGRAGIPQIAFVVTNGKYATEGGVKALDVASTQLRRAGVKVIALGVGTKVDPKELSVMVDDEERILRANSYDELTLNRKNVSRKICQEAGKFKDSRVPKKAVDREITLRPNYDKKYPVGRNMSLFTAKNTEYLKLSNY